MKLDSLLDHDASTFDDTEWHLSLHLGPMKGTVAADFVDGRWLPDGRAYVRFAFVATAPVTFIGFSVIRTWEEDDGTTKIRTCRSETWVPAYSLVTGQGIGFDLFIEPAEWA